MAIELFWHLPLDYELCNFKIRTMTTCSTFDSVSGRLTIFEGSLVLDKNMTLPDFRKNENFSKSEPLISNQSHRSYSLNSLEIWGQPFHVAVYFKSEKLDMITLKIVNAKFGVGWEDFSAEKEIDRKAMHDQILIDNNIFPGEKSWGWMYSEYDEKSGFSSIVLTFGRK